MRSKKDTRSVEERWFEDIKKEVLKFDPVSFCEHYLKVDGDTPLKLNDSGWKFLADIYRYIAVKALEPEGKPVGRLVQQLWRLLWNYTLHLAAFSEAHLAILQSEYCIASQHWLLCKNSQKIS